MKTQSSGETLEISEVTELSAATASLFRDSALAALEDGQKSIDVDLSTTGYLDSCGLGALLALQKECAERGGKMRLINPTPPINQMLELTRMNQAMDVVNPVLGAKS